MHSCLLHVSIFGSAVKSQRKTISKQAYKVLISAVRSRACQHQLLTCQVMRLTSFIPCKSAKVIVTYSALFVTL